MDIANDSFSLSNVNSIELFSISDKSVHIIYFSPNPNPNQPVERLSSLQIRELRDNTSLKKTISLEVEDFIFELNFETRITVKGNLIALSSRSSKVLLSFCLPKNLSSEKRRNLYFLLRTYTGFTKTRNGSKRQINNKETKKKVKIEKKEKTKNKEKIDKKETENNNEKSLGKLGQSLLSTAQILSNALIVGTKSAVSLLDYLGERQRVKGQRSKVEKSSSVSSLVKASAKGSLRISEASYRMSKALVSGVGVLTEHYGSALGEKAFGPYMNVYKFSSASLFLDVLLDGARGGLFAYDVLSSSIDVSLRHLGASIKDNSVKVVRENLGKDSAQVLEESLTAAGNVVLTLRNIQSLRVKSLIKSTAKTTGKVIGDNFAKEKTSELS